MNPFKAYTDCPFTLLGDTPNQEAPIREVEVVGYDGDKYCTILVGGIKTEVKRCYLYPIAVRYEDYKGVKLQFAYEWGV